MRAQGGAVAAFLAALALLSGLAVATPTARRTNVTGVLTALALVFWNIGKK